MKVSVVVASCNRAERLPEFFESFSRMAVATQSPWELILVDNNSTDATRSVVDQYVRNEELPISYRFEGRPGKSNALNTGIETSDGDIIALTDDDCRVAEDWVDAIAREFAKRESLGGLGGRVELFDPEAASIATRNLRSRRRMTRAAQLFSLIIGCNMAFRRSVFDEIGAFDPTFGPGAPIPSAEDVDIVYRSFKAGYELEYSPDVLVYHDHGRRSAEDVNAVNQSYVIGRGAFYRKYISRGDYRILTLATREIAPHSWQVLRSLHRKGDREKAQRRLGQLRAGFRLHRDSRRRGSKE